MGIISFEEKYHVADWFHLAQCFTTTPNEKCKSQPRVDWMTRARWDIHMNTIFLMFVEKKASHVITAYIEFSGHIFVKSYESLKRKPESLNWIDKKSRLQYRAKRQNKKLVELLYMTHRIVIFHQSPSAIEEAARLRTKYS